jgi:fumarate hydratase class I
MGAATGTACRECGCVYFHAVGGAAQVLASRIVRVTGVYWAEKFGAPEAVWVFDVARFPAVVTMDSAGGNLHERVAADSAARLQQLVGDG